MWPHKNLLCLVPKRWVVPRQMLPHLGLAGSKVHKCRQSHCIFSLYDKNDQKPRFELVTKRAKSGCSCENQLNVEQPKC